MNQAHVVGSLLALGALFAAPRAHAQAEHYAPFRFDTAVGGIVASGAEGYGVGVAIEPKYNLHDHVAVGLRLDSAMMFGSGLLSGSIQQWGSAAALAKGEFYLTTSTFRPFAGLGLGVYHLGAQNVSAAGISQQAGTYFGLAPQLGLDIGSFRMAVTYNAIVGASTQVSQTIGSIQTVEASRNFWGIELGFRFGGAPREG